MLSNCHAREDVKLHTHYIFVLRILTASSSNFSPSTKKWMWWKVRGPRDIPGATEMPTEAFWGSVPVHMGSAGGRHFGLGTQQSGRGWVMMSTAALPHWWVNRTPCMGCLACNLEQKETCIRTPSSTCFTKPGATIFIFPNSISFMWVLGKLVPPSKHIVLSFT